VSDDRISFELPAEAVERIAQRAAEIVFEKLERSEPYMTAEQAGEYIAADKRRIYDLIASGRLPSFKDGRKPLVRRADLDDYLRRNGSS
jgi:excisionase family DNA binding protein